MTNTSAAQQMSRRHQVHADLVEAISRGDAARTRRLTTEHSLLTVTRPGVR